LTWGASSRGAALPPCSGGKTSASLDGLTQTTQLSGFRITQPLFFQQNASKKTAHLSGFDPNSGLTLRQPGSAGANRGVWGVDSLQPLL